MLLSSGVFLLIDACISANRKTKCWFFTAYYKYYFYTSYKYSLVIKQNLLGWYGHVTILSDLLQTIQIFLVLLSFRVIGKDLRVSSDTDDKNLKMARFHQPNSEDVCVLLNKKDAANKKRSMKVAVKCFWVFLTESEMSATFKDYLCRRGRGNLRSMTKDTLRKQKMMLEECMYTSLLMSWIKITGLVLMGLLLKVGCISYHVLFFLCHSYIR